MEVLKAVCLRAEKKWREERRERERERERDEWVKIASTFKDK